MYTILYVILLYNYFYYYVIDNAKDHEMKYVLGGAINKTDLVASLTA